MEAGWGGHMSRADVHARVNDDSAATATAQVSNQPTVSNQPAVSNYSAAPNHRAADTVVGHTFVGTTAGGAEPPATHPALGPYYDVREMALGLLLAALAGATGAAAWLYSSGWYVTFMTGNSERLVLEHVIGNSDLAFMALGMVLSFVLGAFVATLCRIFLWNRARHGATLVTMIATNAAWVLDVTMVDEQDPIGALPVACLAFALGALNTSISRRGEVVMPLSYMTGTLVKIGQGLALHLTRTRRWTWVAQAGTYTGFLLGALLGGIAFTMIGTHNSLLALAIAATIIAIGTWRLDQPRYRERDGA